MKLYNKYLINEGKKYELHEIDYLIERVKKLKKKHPKLSFDVIMSQLQKKRVEITSKIGKK